MHIFLCDGLPAGFFLPTRLKHQKLTSANIACLTYSQSKRTVKRNSGCPEAKLFLSSSSLASLSSPWSVVIRSTTPTVFDTGTILAPLRSTSTLALWASSKDFSQHFGQHRSLLLAPNTSPWLQQRPSVPGSTSRTRSRLCTGDSPSSS
jgi:hypothetical protein